TEADAQSFSTRARQARMRRDEAALQALAQEAEVAHAPVSALVLLAESLWLAGNEQAAVRLLEQAQRQHPADFWLNHQLAYYLYEVQPRRLEEAVGNFRAALALRPQSPGVHNNLGSALKEQGKVGEAIASYQQALRLDPTFAKAYNNLGNA